MPASEHACKNACKFTYVHINRHVNKRMNIQVKITVYARHGILRKRASVARGKFVSDCGRKCGNHLTQVVEGNFLKVFQIIV